MGLRRSYKPENLIINGDFSNGTASWTAQAGTRAAANNILTVTASGVTYNWACCVQSTSLIVGHAYYVRAKVTANEAGATSITVYAGAGQRGIQDDPVAGTQYTLSGVFVETGAGSSARSYMYYPTKELVAGKTMDVQEFFLVDLGNSVSPLYGYTAAQCDELFPEWFDGKLITNHIIGGFHRGFHRGLR